LIRQPGSYDLKLLFWERGETHSLRVLKEKEPHAHSILLVVGPEGGFAPEEIALASAEGFHLVTLGKRILRTETAALAAISVAQFLWGDLGGTD
jgi:16S rRNA (uracil1498-N3)-methyltransferase